jgi:2,4-dienoyl-CoA reductase-like NADH-dependent reductase (Old Yellow Enzyme family)
MQNPASLAPLFRPGRVGGIAVRSRIAVAPMTRISAGSGGVPTETMAAYYARYAEGGFALVITEGTYFDTRHSQGYRDQPGIATDAQAEGWRRVVERVHAAGAPIVLQLIHAGALMQENDYGAEPIAPSAVQPKGEQAARYYGSGPFRMPRAMTREEIAATVAAYGRAAARAQAAGFDGVELHGANGYLPDQFLTGYTNKRTDAYGGPLENRLRFHAEVIAALRAATGPDFTIGCRLSETKINDHEHSWSGPEEARAIFRRVAAAGASYIHISAHRGIQPVYGGDKTLAGLAKAATTCSVIACGGLNDTARSIPLIEAGEADMIALGKAALADSSWPDKLRRGEAPRPFHPEMTTPVATLAAYEAALERLAAAVSAD